MSHEERIPRRILDRLKSWEGFLLIILVAIILVNSLQSPAYLSVQNQINLFILSIEKIIVVLVMTFIIINAEIDLSVASMIGLAACTLAWLFERGIPIPMALAIGLLVGVLGGAFNGFWIAWVGLPSLVVTLAMLIGYRGLARVLLEDRSIGGFPDWFDTLGVDYIYYFSGISSGHPPVLGFRPLRLCHR
jgi:rhamnose transport system permease protein